MPDKNPQQVKSMFAQIANRYDLGNDILSLGLHRYWEWRGLSLLPENSQSSCLDLCTGTGALLKKLSKKYKHVVAADFCLEMLELAEARHPHQDYPNLTFQEADALNLAFPDQTFDVVTISYGVRNFANLEQGLKECLRVLKSDGQLLVIEFGKPDWWFKPFYKFYSKYLLPSVGFLITGNRQAYQYLPETVSEFPSGGEFQAILKKIGFVNLNSLSLTFGITRVYLASAQ